MNENPTTPFVPKPKRWGHTVFLIAIMLLCAVGTLAGVWILGKAGLSLLGCGAKTAHAATTIAEAFRRGTIRQEFLSTAVQITGSSAFQFATLRQNETFRREESGSLAWGLIPLPKVVVQAQAPVEYTFSVNFEPSWNFVLADNVLTVNAPAIHPNTPALDVSALQFYTIEGSLFGADKSAQEALRKTLTTELQKRAWENVNLVREAGRQKVAAFVEKWLREKYGETPTPKLRVVFADEQTPADFSGK